MFEAMSRSEAVTRIERKVSLSPAVRDLTGISEAPTPAQSLRYFVLGCDQCGGDGERLPGLLPVCL